MIQKLQSNGIMTNAFKLDGKTEVYIGINIRKKTSVNGGK